MPERYRKTDLIASGNPIVQADMFPTMREIVRTEFGARLFQARKAAGVSQASLGAVCGLVQSSVAELETTGQGSASVTKIARKLEVDAHWLATGEGDRHSVTIHFTRELKEKLAGLTERELVKAENMLRAAYEMQALPLPANRKAA